MKLKKIEKDIRSDEGLEGRISSLSIEKSESRTPQISLFNHNESDEEEETNNGEEQEDQEKLELESFKNFLNTQATSSKN